MKYEIKGGEFPVVICSLSDGESMITERGSMVWQTPNIKMETRGGGVGKMFARAFSGDSMFQNIYTAQGDGVIAFGTSFPGRILPMRISPDNELVMQKRSFLASTPGVRLEVVFNKKLGAGLFGGGRLLDGRADGKRNPPSTATVLVRAVGSAVLSNPHSPQSSRRWHHLFIKECFQDGRLCKRHESIPCDPKDDELI